MKPTREQILNETRKRNAETYSRALVERDEARALARKMKRERDEWEEYSKKMFEENVVIRRERDATIALNTGLQAGLGEVREQRDANYQEVVALRTKNLELLEQVKVLRETLEQVMKPDLFECPFCKAWVRHTRDCPRQKALGLVKE